MSKTKEVKEMIISNFIEYYTTIDSLRDEMFLELEGYMEEDHVDEIGQAFPTTVMTERDICVEKLGHFVSDDADESYDKLVEQSGIDGSVMADDVVLMWEPLEDRYTVDQLLDEI